MEKRLPMGEPIAFRSKTIRVDVEGRVCLSDFWAASKFSSTKRPSQWRRLPSTQRLQTALAAQIVGRSHNKAKARGFSVYYTEAGRSGATFAHPILALAYAEYLSPTLALEVKETFLRARAGDAALADEILQRATSEENEWAGVRALARSKRLFYTSTLQAHGVEGKGYADCTNATYGALFNGTAAQLRRVKGIPSNSNLRDHMATDELVYVMAAEVLASEHINDVGATGNAECETATSRSAANIRRAIEADRRERKKAS